MKKILNTLLIAAMLLSVNATRSHAQALNFGAYSYVTIGTVLTNSHSYTKEAWVRVYPTNANHGRNIISAYDHPFWIENGKLSAANNYGFTAVPTIQDPQSFPMSTWVHVAVTYDAPSSTMKLYRDGSLVASTVSAGGYMQSTMQIGATNYGDFLDGTDVDEARVWGVALSQAQIQSNMNCDVQGRSDLLAYYKFDEGTPGGNNLNIATATDYSGNGNSGTFANFNLTGSSNNYISGRTVYSVAAITGGSSACAGHTVSLSDATSGGTWSSGSASLATVNASGVVTAVAAGSPVISYTASNGCIATKTVAVSASPAIAATVTNPSCNGGAAGSISTTVTGGAPSYSYSWSNGATTSGISNLIANTYSLTVTDANSCTTSASYTLTQPAPTSASISVTPASNTYTGGVANNIYLGYGPQSATLTATAVGGSGFTYSWTSGTYLSSTAVSNPSFTPTLAGHYTYTCTVTNSSGCTSTGTVSLCVVDAADHSHANKVLVCHNGGNTLSISSNAVNAHLSNHNDHLGACYDACDGGAKSSNTQSQVIVMENEMDIKAFPNPFGDEIHIKIESNEVDYADVIVYDLTGRVMESKPNQQVGSEITLGHNLTNGMYIIEIRNGDLSRKMKVVKM
jgi:Concanavalin A-like lectin/glucanases superfamily/SprB repeat/Secretion system C-terminal sorting domain